MAWTRTGATIWIIQRSDLAATSLLCLCRETLPAPLCLSFLTTPRLISRPQLKDALASSGVEISLKELKALWVAADKDGSSGLSYDEFVNAIEKLDDAALRDRITGASAEDGGGCIIA